jgi:hypothetical protein
MVIGGDVEESGCDLIVDIIPVFALRDWEKPRKNSVSTDGLRAEI